MKSEQEVYRAGKLFAWYVASGRIRRQNPATQDSIIGTIAAIEWVLEHGGADRDQNPVAGTLRDIEAMHLKDTGRPLE
jgi:hypothetical protein